MKLTTISTLKEEANDVPLLASVAAQLQTRTIKSTKNGKPYYDLTFADSSGTLSLKIWSDTALYSQAEHTDLLSIVKLDGEWTQNAFGINGSNVSWEPLDDALVPDFLAGDPEIRSKQENDYQTILDFCAGISDPRLHALCCSFLETMGERFRRTAAARKNHHARRGGLVEHVAQMMRSTAAICSVYPQLNLDLLLTGVLFHDCGKLWENTYPESGFAQQYSIHGEMLGHIPLGVELVNKLWRELNESSAFDAYSACKPSTEEVRLHLLHLIASHHGQLEYGSPILPKTPEAMALHYIDNLDAKLEMARDAYAQSAEIAPGVYERVFPLPSNLVRPLRAYQAPVDPSSQPEGQQSDHQDKHNV